MLTPWISGVKNRSQRRGVTPEPRLSKALSKRTQLASERRSPSPGIPTHFLCARLRVCHCNTGCFQLLRSPFLRGFDLLTAPLSAPPTPLHPPTTTTALRNHRQVRRC